MPNDQQQITFPLDPASVQILVSALTPYFGAALVSQIVAGTGITISPVTGVGVVTVTNPGVLSLLVGAGVTLSGTTGNITITVSDATLSTSDITTNNVSTSKHGFAPKLPNDATKYLDGTGAYSVPAGGASFASVSGSDSLGSTATPVNVTHTITHGLGKTPVFYTIAINNLRPQPVTGGVGNVFSDASGWLYLDTNGNAIGGFTHNTQFNSSFGTPPTEFVFSTTSVTGTSANSAGTSSATITLNNFTATTFDIVYTTSASGATGNFSYSSVNWTAMG